MAENKTKATEQSVTAFLDSVTDGQRRQDCYAVLDLMKAATGEEPKIWGGGMVGVGAYHYKYESGHEGDMFLTGFAPRKQNLTLYVMPGSTRYAELMQKLGKYKGGKSCIYVKKLADIDLNVLQELIEQSVQHLRTLYK